MHDLCTKRVKHPEKCKSFSCTAWAWKSGILFTLSCFRFKTFNSNLFVFTCMVLCWRKLGSIVALLPFFGSWGDCLLSRGCWCGCIPLCQHILLLTYQIQCYIVAQFCDIVCDSWWCFLCRLYMHQVQQGYSSCETLGWTV